MTRRAGVRLWRWRRNPLRRTSDIVEAWILLVAWVLAVVGGVLTGVLTTGAMQRSADQVRSTTHERSAVLTREAPHGASGPANSALKWGTVRWTDPDGSVHTGRTRVPASAAPGTHVTVWTNGRGVLTSPPPSRADSTFQSVLGGLWAGAATVGVVVGGTKLARSRLERRRLDQWDEEWARVDTPWGWKTG
ncbi:Rv1733c family protein [Streptomyces thermoalcalitolerans]|uniref:Rv1733c family protein n=1 Tax=Streptomyces thermoalcalitolerans TaxID=65605 RepID=UPI0031DDA57C